MFWLKISIDWESLILLGSVYHNFFQTNLLVSMQFKVVLVFGKGQGKARLLFWPQLSFTTDTCVIKFGVIKVGAWLGQWLVSPLLGRKKTALPLLHIKFGLMKIVYSTSAVVQG